jgi:hypothetical protein
VPGNKFYVATKCHNIEVTGSYNINQVSGVITALLLGYLGAEITSVFSVYQYTNQIPLLAKLNANGKVGMLDIRV